MLSSQHDICQGNVIGLVLQQYPCLYSIVEQGSELLWREYMKAAEQATKIGTGFGTVLDFGGGPFELSYPVCQGMHRLGEISNLCRELKELCLGTGLGLGQLGNSRLGASLGIGQFSDFSLGTGLGIGQFYNPGFGTS